MFARPLPTVCGGRLEGATQASTQYAKSLVVRVASLVTAGSFWRCYLPQYFCLRSSSCLPPLPDTVSRFLVPSGIDTAVSPLVCCKLHLEYGYCLGPRQS